MKKFDLNIEKILENWEIYHAVREIISNALDEQVLTKTEPIQVYKENDSWIIRDFGRGLSYNHLTQNENNEKLTSSKVIGKYGIGLKDALATFYRHNIKLEIISRFNKITLDLSKKEGFENIKTLHAIIDEDVDKHFVGTKVILKNLANDDMDKAKNLFLHFSNHKVLSKNKYGEIIDNDRKTGWIYYNGLKIAEEDNFIFNYNITSYSKKMKRALNRERNNVGRVAYADTIKKIILNSDNDDVVLTLSNEFIKIGSGVEKDEVTWIDVQDHTIKSLNKTGNYVFLTADEMRLNPNIIDEISRQNKTPLIIPITLKGRIAQNNFNNDIKITDLGQFIFDYQKNFAFDFIEIKDLTNKEKEVYSYTNKIIEIFGGIPKIVKDIKISNTMHNDLKNNEMILGCWDSRNSIIIIKRSQLKRLEDYAGTLIHELIHAKTGFSDVSRLFEYELTKYIGLFAKSILLK